MSLLYTKWLTVAFATRIIIAMPLTLFITLFQLRFIYSPSTFTANGQYRSSTALISCSVNISTFYLHVVKSIAPAKFKKVYPVLVAPLSGNKT